VLRFADVGEVDVAHRRLCVPPEHGNERFRELRTAVLVDATRVDPEILEAILFSLCCAENELLVPRLRRGNTLLDVLESHFVFVVLEPSVREDCIGLFMIAAKRREHEVAALVSLEKSHGKRGLGIGS
jgi:hypothetical protein